MTNSADFHASVAADENLFSSLFNEESAEYSMISSYSSSFSFRYNFPMNSHFNQRPLDPSHISICGDGDNARRVFYPNKSPFRMLYSFFETIYPPVIILRSI